MAKKMYLEKYSTRLFCAAYVTILQRFYIFRKEPGYEKNEK